MQDRAEATRQAIVLAAAQEFDRTGYAATSIAAIAARAECTSGALYFHFAGKDRMAAAVIEAHFAAWRPLTTRLETLPIPAVERLVALSYAVMRAFRDDVVVRAGARLWSERRAIDALLPRPFVGWITLIATLLDQARSEGDVPAHLDSARTADALVCALFGVHTVSDALDARARIEEHLDGCWLLLLPGLLDRPADLHTFLSRCRTQSGALTDPEPALSAPLT